MNQIDFNALVEKQFNVCRSTLKAKGKEYAPHVDRLDNFKRAAEWQGVTPVNSLAGMWSKHVISLSDLVHSSQRGLPVSEAMLEEKVKDFINYAILFKALLYDLDLVAKEKRK